MKKGEKKEGGREIIWAEVRRKDKACFRRMRTFKVAVWEEGWTKNRLNPEVLSCFELHLMHYQNMDGFCFNSIKQSLLELNVYTNIFSSSSHHFYFSQSLLCRMVYERKEGVFSNHINFKKVSVAFGNRTDDEETSPKCNVSPQWHPLFAWSSLPWTRFTLKMFLRDMPYSHPW